MVLGQELGANIQQGHITKPLNPSLDHLCRKCVGAKDLLIRPVKGKVAGEMVGLPGGEQVSMGLSHLLAVLESTVHF